MRTEIAVARGDATRIPDLTTAIGWVERDHPGWQWAMRSDQTHGYVASIMDRDAQATAGISGLTFTFYAPSPAEAMLSAWLAAKDWRGKLS